MPTVNAVQRKPIVHAVPFAPSAAEHFIPLRKSELVDWLGRSPGLATGDSDRWRRFCLLVDGLIHRQYQATLEELKDAYAAFDPDSDTRPGAAMKQAALDERRDLLFGCFGRLLERANFVRLSQDAIEHALADCSHWGLNLMVDFELFERLEIFARGDVLGTRYRRRLRNRFRPEAIEVPIYQRLAVIFRLRPKSSAATSLDTDEVYIKLFKDIPKMDLDMLLPGTQVKMSILDRAKILLPTMSGIAILVAKIVQGALLVAAAGFYGSLAFLGLVGGTVGYGARSFFGYLNTKQKYQLNLTQSLYYQNLDNNAGAIYRLLDDAEEQENREVVLAYFHLWRHADDKGWTAAELDERVETFLRVEAKATVNFEIDDALAKLERLKVVEPRPGNRWAAAPIDRAIQTLLAHWTSLPTSSDSLRTGQSSDSAVTDTGYTSLLERAG